MSHRTPHAETPVGQAAAVDSATAVDRDRILDVLDAVVDTAFANALGLGLTWGPDISDERHDYVVDHIVERVIYHLDYFGLLPPPTS